MNNSTLGTSGLTLDQQLEMQKEQQKYYSRSQALDIAVKISSNNYKDADTIIGEAKKIENYLLNG